ncbi:chemoreceptor glutamine deamidase CheD [Simiduia agarivorans]|uniref:Probable chemoreceptor glutamine deamidase CheD n=1 Tax=Simiduia agarivorans (strain DSM 21679 / JCM 13881 / BCRC 17597 / SA1) TaxID=1117647 RepID=K4KTM6_SIMAS|nr:chemoreceptor glutamine deamidase CheD [Simiduia agarivorans]AFU97322.1 chemoreceptor glutamine deamidase CheD [Simiduia agarivorans SA1 = DSM 21679]
MARLEISVPVRAGFEHINRYWDRQRHRVTAKILPGEFFVSVHQELIATTLGSCVAACLWDARAGVGGMNHFMLAVTGDHPDAVRWGNQLSEATRYGNYAMEHLINEMLKAGARREQLVAKVFGGANLIAGMSDIGRVNSEFVCRYLRDEKITLVSKDLLGASARKVLFDPVNGKVFIKRLPEMGNRTVQSRESTYREGITNQSMDGDIELFE